MMLLDEPMAGLGQEDIKRIAALIRTVARDRTVLMVEHNMSVVADLSDTITVLARGEVLAEGPYATVSRILRGRRPMSGRVMVRHCSGSVSARAQGRACRPGTGESHIFMASASRSAAASW